MGSVEYHVISLFSQSITRLILSNANECNTTCTLTTLPGVYYLSDILFWVCLGQYQYLWRVFRIWYTGLLHCQVYFLNSLFSLFFFYDASHCCHIFFQFFLFHIKKLTPLTIPNALKFKALKYNRSFHKNHSHHFHILNIT